MELTEREMGTLGYLLESTGHRASVGHHSRTVKKELVEAGLMVEDGWNSRVGSPYYKLTPLGVAEATKYEAARKKCSL